MIKKAKLKVRTGDRVMVISGKDKGVVGLIKKVNLSKLLVYVEGVRERVNRKARSEEQSTKLMPLHVSKVSHIDPKLNRPTKVGIKFDSNGNKILYSKRSGEVIRGVGGKNDKE